MVVYCGHQLIHNCQGNSTPDFGPGHQTTMNFDPMDASEMHPSNTIFNLELRSVICVPIVRMRTGQGDATGLLTAGNETVGLL